MKPQAINDLQLAFPADVQTLLPTNDPRWREYRDQYANGKSWGFKLFGDWFYSGIEDLVFVPKEGIDTNTALRHIRAIMGSFQPKHEDKTCACALLFETWFESATWKKRGKS